MQFVLEHGMLLGDRYRIGRSLGQGSNGVTYGAQVQELDQVQAQNVAIKVLSLAGLKDWKQLDLFEREAQVLQHLNHPGIPQYIDFFQTKLPGGEAFCLVQTLAPGQSLAQRVAAGWRGDEAEIRRIARSVLDILVYLQGLHPPIIHRDIKPQNIILGNDGQVFLVDFGAVQSVYQETMFAGSTIVGTYGYMAPEQFRGAARPASDLYALGGTVLFLLTHRSPAELPQSRMKIQFRSQVQVSDSFADWLDGLLEPVIEDRFATAAEAIAALEDPTPRYGKFLGSPSSNVQLPQHSKPTPKPIPKPIPKPSNSPVQLSQGRGHFDLIIPAGGLRTEALALGGFALFWNGFILLWTFGSIAMGAPFFFPLFSIPFWVAGIWMLTEVISGLFSHVELRINHSRYQLRQQILGWHRLRQGPVSDLYRAELQTRYSQNDRPVQCIALIAGAKTYQFGTLLSEPEKLWLAQELSYFLNNYQSTDRSLIDRNL